MVTVTGLLIGAAIGAIPAASLGWIACAWQQHADQRHAEKYAADTTARVDTQLADLAQMATAMERIAAASKTQQDGIPRMAAPTQQPTYPSWDQTDRNSGPRHQQAA